MGNWEPLVLALILLFVMGSIGLLAADVAGYDPQDLDFDADAEERVENALGIVNTLLPADPDDFFLCRVPTFMGGPVLIAVVNFFASPNIECSESTLEETAENYPQVSKFIIGLALLPSIVLYPFILIELLLFTIGLIKLTPLQG